MWEPVDAEMANKVLIALAAAMGFSAFVYANVVQATPPLPSGIFSREAVLGALGKARFVPRSVLQVVAAL